MLFFSSFRSVEAGYCDCPELLFLQFVRNSETCCSGIQRISKMSNISVAHCISEN